MPCSLSSLLIQPLLWVPTSSLPHPGLVTLVVDTVHSPAVSTHLVVCPLTRSMSWHSCSPRPGSGCSQRGPRGGLCYPGPPFPPVNGVRWRASSYGL